MQPYSNVQGVVSDGTHLAPDPGHQQARQMDNDALAIKEKRAPLVPGEEGLRDVHIVRKIMESSVRGGERSEEHTSELQSRGHLVCRLLLEKKKNRNYV